MIPSMRKVRAVWLIIAIGLGFMPGGSVDTNLLVGWAFLVWTFPFSVLWSVYAYDAARSFMTPSIAHVVGSALVVVSAFAFWFFLIPHIWANARRRHGRDR